MTIEITDIIGREKTYEPPFKIGFNAALDDTVLQDSKGAIVLERTDIWLSTFSEQGAMLQHICDLLNREHEEK